MLDGVIPRGVKYKFKVKTEKVGVGYPGLSLYIVTKKTFIMAKDRFNRRSNWDTGFKYTGQLMPKEPKSLQPKESLSKNQYVMLSSMLMDKEYLNDWEVNFLRDIITRNLKLSEKQTDKVRSIFMKIEKNKVLND